MLLWYAKFIRKQSAERCFDIRIKDAAYSDRRRGRRVSGIQFKLHLHLCSNGSGFFQDICFALLPYDRSDGTNANILPLGSRRFCLGLVAAAQLGKLRNGKGQQRTNQNAGKKDAANQSNRLLEAAFLG